jgi:hypothetical protein
MRQNYEAEQRANQVTIDRSHPQKEEIRLTYMELVQEATDLRDKKLQELAEQFMKNELSSEEHRAAATKVEEEYKAKIKNLASKESAAYTALISAHLATVRSQ